MTFPAFALSLSICLAHSQTAAPPPQNESKPPAKAETAAPTKPEANAAPAPAKKPKKVWTTDDLDGKSPRTNSDATEAVNFDASNSSKGKTKSRTQSNTQPGTQSQSGAVPQEQDPAYYQQRLAPLRSELSKVQSEINRLQATPTDYRTGSKTESVLGQGTHSYTVQNELERLQRRRESLQKRIAEIEAEAQRNGVTL